MGRTGWSVLLFAFIALAGYPWKDALHLTEALDLTVETSTRLVESELARGINERLGEVIALGGASCHTAAEWTARSIYQIVVDRFAPDSSVILRCDDLTKYCGGTFKGIADRLDYIQGMGFDAISISPIVENVESGYHGYWPKNLFDVNGHFGSANDLKLLVRECHARGIWVMVEVGMNHMGGRTDLNIQHFYPFNDSSHYHGCYYTCCGDCGCCSTKVKDCEEEDVFTTENCRLAPPFIDLDQSHPFVEQRLIEWLRWALEEFAFDGFRFDTVKHVSKTFWKKLKSSSPCFFLGDNPSDSSCYLAKYQTSRAMDGLLDYSTTSTLRAVFGRAAPMTSLGKTLRDTAHSFENGSTGLLGSFLDSHTLPRFLSFQPSRSILKGALVWMFMSQGIPVMYYGTEQGLSGAADPANREPLWYTGFNSQANLYLFVRKLQELRKRYRLWEHKLTQLHAEDHLYIFSRGSLLILLTNSVESVRFEGILKGFGEEGRTYCDVLVMRPATDCFTIPEKGGKVGLSMDGFNAKIYAPASV